MLENSLNSRNKFVNKVVDKINSLKDDLNLLYKVDKKISRKIFKNSNNQLIGGAPIEPPIDTRELELAAYALEKEILMQEELLSKQAERASAQNTNLQTKLVELKISLDSINNKIKNSRLRLNNFKIIDNEPIEINLRKWGDENITNILETHLQNDWSRITREIRTKLFDDSEEFFKKLQTEYRFKSPSQPSYGDLKNIDTNNIIKRSILSRDKTKQNDKAPPDYNTLSSKVNEGTPLSKVNESTPLSKIPPPPPDYNTLLSKVNEGTQLSKIPPRAAYPKNNTTNIQPTLFPPTPN